MPPQPLSVQVDCQSCSKCSKVRFTTNHLYGPWVTPNRVPTPILKLAQETVCEGCQTHTVSIREAREIIRIFGRGAYKTARHNCPTGILDVP